VRNQGDGWGWTLDFLARAIEEIAVTGHQGEAAHDAFASYAPFATAIGRRLAELHAVLAEPTDDAAFDPVEANSDELRNWADAALEQFSHALAVLGAPREWPDDDSRRLADEVAARAASLPDTVRRLAASGAGALCTRVHGDFHLGQVLVVQGDAFIIDFEGEPSRPLPERRRKSCPLRDVAGLLRSFDYAAATAAPGRGAASPSTEERRGPLLERFRIEAARKFLDSYRAVLEEAPRRWVSHEAELPLLDLFLLEKAAYEICYEASNRPSWLPIPLRGLHAIVERLLAHEPAA
jgi:maltose alpha-D-glucosyltransferase/alpha-amylase